MIEKKLRQLSQKKRRRFLWKFVSRLEKEMASLLAREEPLLKQLVRSRACKRRDPIATGFGPQIRNTRSFSQPPPRQRDSAPQPQPAPGTLTPPNRILVSPGSPGTTYTLQFLPYSLVCQASAMSSIIPVSLSQPDLRKCGAQSHPDLLNCLSPAAISSRCSSLSPVRCLSPAQAHMSPRNGSCFSSHAGTPARAVSPGPQSRPTTPTIVINSEELFYAGGSEYYTSDFLRGGAFSQKLAGHGYGHKGIGGGGWASPRDGSSPSKDDLGLQLMSANWEKSLEVERTEGRKYSLTDAFLFPHPETVGIRDRSPIRDGNNNNNSNSGQVGQQHRRQSRGENRFSPQCCCFNDLCCKICLVFNKEDSNLTLEQLQNRAIRNIMKQKNAGFVGCKPKSNAAAVGQRCSPEPSLVPAKKKVLESSKIKSGSRYQC